MSTKSAQPASLLVVAMAMCAGLYALGSYLTAYIPSPWGFGQFRPAVVIPSFFAAVFGPLPAAVGAALGTLIVDSWKHGENLRGQSGRGCFWTRFIMATLFTLTFANLIVAFLYVFLFKVLYLRALELGLEALVYLSIGLTIWWFVTMLPFVLLVTPPLIRAVAIALPSVVPEEVRVNNLKGELPKASFSLAMMVPGILMVLIGLATTFTVLGSYTTSFFGEVTSSLIQLMYYVSGAVLLLLGVATLTGQKLLRQNSSRS